MERPLLFRSTLIFEPLHFFDDRASVGVQHEHRHSVKALAMKIPPNCLGLEIAETNPWIISKLPRAYQGQIGFALNLNLDEPDAC